MRRVTLTAAAILAAVFLWFVLTLPPRPAAAAGQVEESLRRVTMAGAVHVHSTRSDGSEDVEAIAAAASRAGLRFLVVTDHGDATRPPDPPAYRSGVLVLEAVEISTNGGHYLALDMPAAPYPLGGEARAVVEDVRRLGGFGVVAHPDSPKPELQWKDWTVRADGVEWLSLDSEWRDEARTRLARVAAGYALRGAPALASILDRPTGTLARWDAAQHRVVALAAHDAHGGALEGSSSFLSIPSYEASFRTFAVRALLRDEPTGDAERDGRILLDAIRGGRVFSAVDAIAAPAFVSYRLSRDGRVWEMGETAPIDGGRLSASSTLPPGGRIVLVHGGRDVAESAAGRLDLDVKEPGAYRIEVRVDGAPGEPPVPWVLANPIYLGARPSEVQAVSPTYLAVVPLNEPGVLEKDPRSTASVAVEGDRRVLEFILASGERSSQYAAMAVPVRGVPGRFDSVSFDARSREPMRVSVQLRFNALAGARWTHSVYLSPEPERVVVPLDRLLPAEPASTSPDFSTVSSLLFVVDLTNARPGQSGRFEVSNLALTAMSR